MKFRKEDCHQVSHKAADFYISSNQCIIQSAVDMHLPAAPWTLLLMAHQNLTLAHTWLVVLIRKSW